ncbi:MAG TPA: NAD(P)-dependent oxidoreductase [Candidatus Paceibacterota bacterium]|nr:NAD(P)-dependent oxidoreductase [Candidatus Paceibacterota bacterium]
MDFGSFAMVGQDGLWLRSAMIQRPEQERIGVIGLGLMGTALTERLLDHGYGVAVWNRTREKAAPLIAKGAQWSDSPLADCRRVIISLFTSEVVAEVLQQMDAGLQPGQIIVDTTTGEPEQTAALGKRLAARGVRYLDAPISGSSKQTRDGEATVIAGGDRATFDACADLWRVIGAKVFHVGPCGSAAQMKLISNLVLGLNRAVLAEGLAFAEALGVAPAAALEVLKGSNAYSRAMDVKGRKLVERDYTVQAKLSQHLKDVRLMLQAARAAGLPLPLTQTHGRLLDQAETAGLGELDNSAILEVLRLPGGRRAS